MRAWLFQDTRQKEKLGEAKCPWSVGWIDPDGKRRSKRIGSKSMAAKFRRKTEGELAAGIYKRECRENWSDFRCEYETKLVGGLKVRSQTEIKNSLSHFERICKPRKLSAISTATIVRPPYRTADCKSAFLRSGG